MKFLELPSLYVRFGDSGTSKLPTLQIKTDCRTLYQTMKRHLIYLVEALLAVVTFGCTLDGVEERENIELTIQLTMASQLNTRDARPLEGVDNWQHVTAVRVYLFRSDTEDGEFTIYQPSVNYREDVEQKIEYIDVEAFKKSEIYKGEKFEQHSIVFNPKLPEGYYRLLAIGVDEDESLFDIIQVDSKLDEILKTFEDNPVTNEFFSGYSETLHVTNSIGKSLIDIEMKRCVAGVLLYVTNIPTQYNGTTISNIKLILSGYSQTTDIVNRTWKSDVVESDIVLADFSAVDANETIGNEKRFYSGRFIIPSETSKLTNSTMRLAFFNGDVELKSKNVVMINASDNDYETPELNIDKDGTHYNIIANHIYCIGFRSKDINEPINLSDESDEVKITPSGSWQADVDITL